MTADIRTAAQREAEEKYPKRVNCCGEIVSCHVANRKAFADGAAWGMDRVTPTREQIERALIGRDFIAGADAILALMTRLAEGEA